MKPPRRLWHVEWSVARDWDHPLDRVDRARNFVAAESAAAQVAAIRRIEATHGELIGVWLTDDLEWTPVDPDSLPLRADDAEEDHLRRVGLMSHPDAKVNALIDTEEP